MLKTFLAWMHPEPAAALEAAWKELEALIAGLEARIKALESAAATQIAEGRVPTPAEHNVS